MVEFLIDTGADSTTLHPADAIRVWPPYLAHNFRSDPRLTKIGGIGGASSYVQREAQLDFNDDTRGPIGGEFTINIAESRGDNAVFPSLLGRDVLQFFRLTVSNRDNSVTLDLR